MTPKHMSPLPPSLITRVARMVLLSCGGSLGILGMDLWLRRLSEAARRRDSVKARHYRPTDSHPVLTRG
jgi:hypothetical protein